MLVMQVLKGVSSDTSALDPNTIKQLSDAIFLQLNALQNTSYSNGYKAAKHEIADYCMQTFGS